MLLGRKREHFVGLFLALVVVKAATAHNTNPGLLVVVVIVVVMVVIMMMVMAVVVRGGTMGELVSDLVVEIVVELGLLLHGIFKGFMLLLDLLVKVDETAQLFHVPRLVVVLVTIVIVIVIIVIIVVVVTVIVIAAVITVIVAVIVAVIRVAMVMAMAVIVSRKTAEASQLDDRGGLVMRDDHVVVAVSLRGQRKRQGRFESPALHHLVRCKGQGCVRN